MYAPSHATPSRRPLRGRTGLIAVTALVLTGAGGIASAAIPDSVSESVTMCRVSATGAVRVIDAQSGDACKSTETTLKLATNGVRVRGGWWQGAKYASGDIVLVDGSSYVAKSANSGVRPPAAGTWTLLAAAGAPGASGATGAPGATGATGATGAPGATGATGAKGDTGMQGAPGAKGDIGPKGDVGVKGDIGPKGDVGTTGATGPQGEVGAKGDTGLQGEVGAKGDIGPQGDVGAKGDAGPQGEVGATGATGPQGPAGADGKDATQTKIAFMGGHACCTSNQVIPAGNNNTTNVAFTNGQYGAYNIGGGFNFDTGKFTAPVGGVYDVQTDLSVTGSPGALYQFFIRSSGGFVTQEIGNVPSGGQFHINMSSTVNTAVAGGSTYWVEAYSPGSLTIDGYKSSFSGHIVFPN